jgi:small subunit ribosomal protein S7
MAKLVVGSMPNEKIEKIINYIMKNGKKSVARKIYADMLKDIKSNGHMNPEIVLETAIENASPSLMIKSKRMGGSVYQVPVEVKQDKKLFFAFKWILAGTASKTGKPMYKKLSEEVMAAYGNQ